ncbi:MAG: hypothetical protein AAF368_18220, partial [Planctomycetota bacterium]
MEERLQTAVEDAETRPTLIVQTIYFETDDDPAKDRERESAARLGSALYGLLTRPADAPWRHGHGIPVRVATEAKHVALDEELNEAQHLVLVPVLGEALLVDERRRREAIQRVNAWHTKIGATGCVLPLLVNGAWRSFADDLVPSPKFREVGQDLFEPLMDVVSAAARVLLGDTPLPKLYISHAATDDDDVASTAIHLFRCFKDSEGASHFFRDFELVSRTASEQVAEENKLPGALIAIRSDRSHTLAWCQRELMRAKRLQWPTLVVDVLTDGEERAFPYGGNAPTMVWRRDSGKDDSSRRVALRASAQTLAWRHHRLEAERVIKA